MDLESLQLLPFHNFSRNVPTGLSLSVHGLETGTVIGFASVVTHFQTSLSFIHV